MRLDATIANVAWLASSLPEWLRFRRAASHIEATQRRRLAGYLRGNSATDFGKEHDFDSLDSWEAYAERVPTRRYDDYQPWIERVAAGAKNVLTAEPVRLLEPTSGSSGAEKWVPYNPGLQAEFHRAVAAWVTDLYLQSPALMGGRAYWSVTPQARHETRGTTEVPVGFDDDSAYLGSFAQGLLKRTMATSPDLKRIRDMEQFWKATLLQLLEARDLRLISVWHPSYLSLLIQHLRHYWNDLLHDLGQGDVLGVAGLRIPADPPRQRELARLGPDDLTAIWPALELISCWGDAHAAASLADLRAAFPGVRLQPKGLVATEAFVSLPFGDLRPLAFRSHFFEFRDKSGNIHPAWSVNQGEIYELIVTTGGGLYRYELGDFVEVTGYYEAVPSLRFVGRADNVSDHYGEKLNEAFVAACLESACKEHNVAPKFAMLAFDAAAPVPGYMLYIETASVLDDEFGATLETGLRRNPHYDLCVRLGQLRPAGVLEVAPGADEIYLQVLSDRGMRLGDIKPTVLSRLTCWSQHFRKSIDE